MTEKKSFKRLVRARMEKTGESYTAARAAMLAGPDEGATAAPVMQVSEASVVEKTGRGWEEWLDLLDDWGAGERAHKEIARWLAEEQGVPGWWAQTVTVGYERARGGRAVGEHADGFSITASKTVNAPVDRLFDAWVDEQQRRRWLPDGQLTERTSTRPKSARFDWGDGSTRVIVGFEVKGESKSSVGLAHERLPDAEEAERMKAYWRARVARLKEVLEG